MHNHTTLYSPCSKIKPEQLIDIYIKAGIDGICITEHNILWEPDQQKQLVKKYQGLIQIFFGIEVNTELGHILVFGSKNPRYTDQISFKELLSQLNPKQSAIIWAHPFRWEFYKKIILDKKLLNNFTAVEYLNGNLTESELQITRQLLSSYPLKLCGGSDTHSVDMAVKYGTHFDQSINSFETLIDYLHHGYYYPVKLR